MLLFQAADILRDVIINEQAQQLSSCYHDYDQLIVLVVWSIAMNIGLLSFITVIEAWEWLKKCVRWLRKKIKRNG